MTRNFRGTSDYQRVIPSFWAHFLPHAGILGNGIGKANSDAARKIRGLPYQNSQLAISGSYSIRVTALQSQKDFAKSKWLYHWQFSILDSPGPDRTIGSAHHSNLSNQFWVQFLRNDKPPS